MPIIGRHFQNKRNESKSKEKEQKIQISRKKRKDLQKLLESIDIEKKEKTEDSKLNVKDSIKASGQKLKESAELEREISEEIMLQQRMGQQTEKEKVRNLIEERKVAGSAPVGKKRVIVFTKGLRQTETMTPVGEDL